MIGYTCVGTNHLDQAVAVARRNLAGEGAQFALIGGFAVLEASTPEAIAQAQGIAQALVELGAEGVYCATVPARGLGVALKVECPVKVLQFNRQVFGLELFSCLIEVRHALGGHYRLNCLLPVGPAGELREYLLEHA